MTSEAKHTPGPWHWWTYTDVDGDPRLDGRAYTVHAFSFKAPANDWGGYDLGGDDEAKANARLIAAAPDMLAALATVGRVLSERRITQKDDELWAAYSQVIAAISKAAPAPVSLVATASPSTDGENK